MSDESVAQVPALYSPRERSQLVARALSEAARRARFSTKRRRTLAGGLRARRGELLMRRIRIWSFGAVVAVPSALWIAYVCLIQTPQYEAEARFTVRGGIPARMDSIGALTGAPSELIVQDTQVITNYLMSRTLVDTLDKGIGLQRFYQKRTVDYFSRLKAHAKIEKVMRYWRWKAKTTIEMPSGIVVFTVRAFSPADAVAIADAAIAASERLVNEMNDQMRQDAVAIAEIERKRAMAGVVKARANLEAARNAEGILSGDATSSALVGLLAEVRGQVIKLQQDYESQRRFVSAEAPQLKTLQSQIDAAKIEVLKLQDEMTRAPVVAASAAAAASAGGAAPDVTSAPLPAPTTIRDRVLSGSMTKLDDANLENRIAERIYGASLAALEHARLTAETKVMYLNTFVRPVAAEEAKYPRPLLYIPAFVAAALALWVVLVGALALGRKALT